MPATDTVSLRAVSGVVQVPWKPPTSTATSSWGSTDRSGVPYSTSRTATLAPGSRSVSSVVPGSSSVPSPAGGPVCSRCAMCAHVSAFDRSVGRERWPATASGARR